MRALAVAVLIAILAGCDGWVTVEAGSSGTLEDAVWEFCQRKPNHEICLIDWGAP